MVLFVKPHQQQEWHIDEKALDYDFLIFREDFMRTFIADKFFVYRLQYCQQTKTPPFLMCSEAECKEYQWLLQKIGAELRQPGRQLPHNRKCALLSAGNDESPLRS